jgi:hypothetical protein
MAMRMRENRSQWSHCYWPSQFPVPEGGRHDKSEEGLRVEGTV